jgi:hypothetical protein
MRVLLSLSLCGLFWALPAAAAWEEVDETENAVVYIDREKIYTEGANPKVLQLIDMKKKNKLGAQSRRLLVEYECKLKKRRTLAFSSFSEPMAQGQVVFRNSVSGNWYPIQSDSVAEAVFKIVCHK